MSLTKRQKEVLDYIRSYILDRGVSPSQIEIREYFKFKSLGSVQRYIKYLVEKGELLHNSRAWRGLSLPEDNRHFDFEKLSSTGTAANNDVGISHCDNEESSSSEAVNIPLLGDIAAGTPSLAVEDFSESIPVPDSMCSKIDSHQSYFALKVVGDSMIEDGILERDIVVCRLQSTALQGQTVAAFIEGEATLKRFYKHGDDKIELRPANGQMDPIFIGPQSKKLHILGVMVGLLRYC